VERTPRIYVALATFFPLVGGAETQTHAQCKRLRDRGYELTVVTFRHDKSWSSHEVIGGVLVIRVAGLLLAGREKLPGLLRKLLYILAIFRMSWMLWQHRRHYDVLHVVQFNALVFPLALVCWLAGKPIIIVVCSVGPSREANLHNKFSLVAGALDADAPWLRIDGATRYGGDLEDLERLGKPVVRFTRWLLDHAQCAVVVLSSRMKAYLAAHNFHLADVQLIPNGVDISSFSPSGADLLNAKRNQTVICVSRLSHEKGIDVLLQAWYLVCKQVPHAKLIIVGNGPLGAQLECMAQALGISDSVEFAGLQRDVPSQLHRGGFAVLPSHWEGMPNALLEAMACGLPCVATRVSGSEDIIEHGVNGLLVEPEDYENMAKAIVTLLCDPLLASKYGNAARATIEQHYSVEHITNMYMELYQRIADHSSQKEDQRAYLPM
jgi:glycosyltransferase involved in cell wall biosynthesis